MFNYSKINDNTMLSLEITMQAQTKYYFTILSYLWVILVFFSSGYVPPLLARVSLSDSIPAGWKILEFKDVGKYSSEVVKLLSDDFTARLDDKMAKCDAGWKIRGYGHVFYNDADSYNFYNYHRLRRSHCANGRILINQYGKFERKLWY